MSWKQRYDIGADRVIEVSKFYFCEPASAGYLASFRAQQAQHALMHQR